MRERERESTYIFLWGKYRLNGKNYIEFIQIKWGEEESKYKKEKMMKYDNKVESSGEIKRQNLIDPHLY